MEIVIASIPHTGTHFFIKLFQELGFGGLRRHGEPMPGVTDAFYTGHILTRDDIEAALRLGDTRPIVSPMRHPYLVEETWLRRGPRDMTELPKAFRTLAHRFSHAHVVPLDAPGVREERFQGLCEAIGREIETDWAITHSLQKTAYMDPSQLTPSPEIRAVVDELAWFFEPMYGGDLG